MSTMNIEYVCKCGNKQTHEEYGHVIHSLTKRNAAFINYKEEIRLCERCGNELGV